MSRTSPTVATVRSLAAGLLLVGLSACTSEAAAPDTPTPASQEPVVSLKVSAPVTKIAGRLSDRDRLALRRDVEALVADYVTAAFLDPGTDAADRFPGFTDGATRLARARGAVLSRADLDRASGSGADGAATIEVVSAEAPVNVLAPRGRPAGATARLDLALVVTPPPGGATDSGEPEKVRLRGRLLLAPVGQGWRVFGFDVVRTGR